MSKSKFLLILFLFLLTFSANEVNAIPSEHFTQRDGYWHDDWGINRNYYGGSDGYLQNLASETLGANRELAFSIGESLRSIYGDEYEVAVSILKYVQTWTVYGYDSENVFVDGVAQDEWAWNADETAHAFNETTGVSAIGDCEDLAFLCATLYEGAGIDSAVVDAPGHVACLIWLPDYPNANFYWDIIDDDRGYGWIWVEATGKNNPLGWTPPDFEDGDWAAYLVSTLTPPVEPTSNPDSDPTHNPLPEYLSNFQTALPIIGIAVVAYLITILGMRRHKKRSQKSRMNLSSRHGDPSVAYTSAQTSQSLTIMGAASQASSLPATKLKFCAFCGASLGEKANSIKFCPYCGEKTAN